MSFSEKDSKKEKQFPRVYIVLVNWCNWIDTIQCLESLMRLDYLNIRVVVCDNASENGSIDHLRSWAEGRDTCSYEEIKEDSYKTFKNPLKKPIKYLVIKEGVKETISLFNNSPLIFIQSSNNKGYAAGCNSGIRYAMSCNDYEYVWLLNNDTIVSPDALSMMVLELLKNPTAGLCGSTLLNYDNPETIQSVGGKYNYWTGRIRQILAGDRVSEIRTIQWDADYIVGASMLVSRIFIEEIGLMNESYFLYFEELDWCLRAKGRFSLAWARESLVYHKEGAATGGSAKGRSLLSEYYVIRNMIRFTMDHYPVAIPTVYSALLIIAVRRILRSQWKHMLLIIKLMFSPGRSSLHEKYPQ